MAYDATPESLHEDLTDWLEGNDERIRERYMRSRRAVFESAGVEVR